MSLQQFFWRADSNSHSCLACLSSEHGLSRCLIAALLEVHILRSKRCKGADSISFTKLSGGGQPKLSAQTKDILDIFIEIDKKKDHQPQKCKKCPKFHQFIENVLDICKNSFIYKQIRLRTDEKWRTSGLKKGRQLPP